MTDAAIKSKLSNADTGFMLMNRLALRPAEAARALGLSERALRQILPQLPHLHAGSAVLIPVDLLREWLRDQAKSENGKVDAVVKDTLSKLGLEN